MLKKSLVVAVILLFIGVAFTSSINANVSKPIIDTPLEDETPIETNYQRIRELVQSIDLRKIIVNPDAVVVSLEEISTIIEENEDCGCDEDSSTTEWTSPVLCTLLYPLLVIVWGLVFIPWIVFDYHPDYLHSLYNNLIDIGIELNCWWA